MQEPITLKELEDLKINLYDLRSSDKIQSPEDTKTINDAILVVQTLKALKVFGVLNVEQSQSL